MNLKHRFNRWLHRNKPTRGGPAEPRWVSPFPPRFLRPAFWRFTRRSVPRGVALGLFSGFIIPVGQILLAAFLALPARANVPVAVGVTFITNPFTVPFWLVIANKVGKFFLKIDEAGVSTQIGREVSSGMWENVSWFFHTAGVTAVGFVILSVIASSVGYLISGFVWRAWIGRKRKTRLQRTVDAQEAAE